MYFILGIVITLLIAFIGILLRPKRKNSIAFFHLYCSSGGGGERVLWHTIEALLKKHPKYTIFIYSHKDVKEDTLRILLKVKELFKIDLVTDQRYIDKIEFVPLYFSALIESKNYPFLTLLFQNLGSILLACEAAYKLMPEVYMETIGFTYTLPIFKLHRCTVITYVHYPTISVDMIQNVRTSTHASFNNRAIFTQSPLLRKAKLLYYQILAYLYAFAGCCADLVMVNSSWTQQHIDSLWCCKTHVVYPPCDVDSFKSLQNDEFKSKSNSLNIISIAQFRPEKNHQLQIEAFEAFLNSREVTGHQKSKFTLYGSCRDDEDEQRVKELRDMIISLDLTSNVEIVVGAPFKRLLEGLKEADVAIHTMENEHFGIVLVECMASGVIPVAHDSGGPRTDIIDTKVKKNGFLAAHHTEFADSLRKIALMKFEDRKLLRKNAIEKADNFSTKVFEKKFLSLVDPYLNK